jgi:hypothetical protein
MLQRTVSTITALALLTVSGTTIADDEPADNPPAPVVRVLSATTVTEPVPGVSISAELSNPHDRPVTFLGYTPDSFSPPLEEGQISPIYRIEFTRDGKWVPHPLGWCGFGMGAIELKPGAKPTFGAFAAGAEEGWEAVRVGITAPEITDIDYPRPVIWSEPFPRQAPDKD